VAERVARSHNLEIFDVQFRREPAGWVLRIFVDVPWEPDVARADEGAQLRAERSGGQGRNGAPADASPSIADCERVSRDVSAILDVEEAIDHRYTLEVSSPGLDRPLRSTTDYRRFVGRLAKIVVSEPVNGQTHFEGRLGGIEQESIVIETTSGRGGQRGSRARVPKRQLVPLSLVARARLEVEF